MPDAPPRRSAPYRVRTARLVLRCWEPDDAEALRAAAAESREHLLPWVSWARDEPQTLDEKVALLRGFRAGFDRDEDYVYGAFEPDEGRIVGGTGLHRRVGPGGLETGYWVHRDHLRRGYATEMAAAMTRVAFEHLRVERVVVQCDARNEASIGVPVRLGFTREARLRRRAPSLTDERGDLLVFTLLADEYPTSPPASHEIEAYDVLGRRII